MKTIKYTITGLCAYFIICCYIVAAQQQVSINEAQKAAVQYLNTKQNRTFSLRETDIQKVNSFKNKENKTLMYETVLNDGQGILLSGSKACLPVLGYFKLPEGKSIFDKDMPCGLKSLLAEYKEQIEWCLKNDTVSLYYQKDWQNLQQEDIALKKNAKSMPTTSTTVTTIVSPLLTSRWGQSYSNDGYSNAYNYYAPLCSGSSSNHCVAGCVAVAMAQIMYYWKYPVYNQSLANYDWCNMADSLNTYSSNYINERNSVARLIRDCGEYAYMDYGCSESGAYTSAARHALVNQFNYNNGALYFKRSVMSEWIGILKTHLNAGIPIYYDGQGQDGGHAFVCDGYNSDDKFHFNWGWRGNSDDWFTIGNLNPSYTFNSSQGAILSLYPSTNQNYCNFDLSLIDYYINVKNYVSKDGTLALPQSFINAIPQNYFFSNATVLTSAYPATIDNFTVPTSWYTISSGTTREYVAHEAIILKPGFHAEAGSNFTARIEPCRNCGTAQNAPAYAKSNVATAEDLAFVQQYLAENPIEESEKSIKVFPNPTTGKVYVLANTEKVTRIEVKSIQGTTVLSSENLPQSEILLDISAQPAGMYLISVTTDNEIRIYKIIKN